MILRIFAALLLLGLASKGWAKEWVMACELDGIKDIRYYKFIDPLLGKSKVKQKILVDGKISVDLEKTIYVS